MVRSPHRGPLDYANEQVLKADVTGADSLYHAAVEILEDGYIGEIVVPFSEMRVDRVEPGEVWGLNLNRNRMGPGSDPPATPIATDF